MEQLEVGQCIKKMKDGKTMYHIIVGFERNGDIITDGNFKYKPRDVEAVTKAELDSWRDAKMKNLLDNYYRYLDGIPQELR